jgi:hypothetical protein
MTMTMSLAANGHLEFRGVGARGVQQVTDTLSETLPGFASPVGDGMWVLESPPDEQEPGHAYFLYCDGVDVQGNAIVCTVGNDPTTVIENPIIHAILLNPHGYAVKRLYHAVDPDTGDPVDKRPEFDAHGDWINAGELELVPGYLPELPAAEVQAHRQAATAAGSGDVGPPDVESVTDGSSEGVPVTQEPAGQPTRDDTTPDVASDGGSVEPQNPASELPPTAPGSPAGAGEHRQSAVIDGDGAGRADFQQDSGHGDEAAPLGVPVDSARLLTGPIDETPADAATSTAASTPSESASAAADSAKAKPPRRWPPNTPNGAATPCWSSTNPTYWTTISSKRSDC